MNKKNLIKGISAGDSAILEAEAEAWQSLSDTIQFGSWLEDWGGYDAAMALYQAGVELMGGQEAVAQKFWGHQEAIDSIEGFNSGEGAGYGRSI